MFRRASILATFYCSPRKGDGLYRPLDIGNAIGALKACVDGLVDAGVIPADSHGVLEYRNPVLLRTAKEHGGRCGLVLEIEGLE